MESIRAGRGPFGVARTAVAAPVMDHSMESLVHAVDAVKGGWTPSQLEC